MNTNLKNALSDAQLDTISGGCYRPSYEDDSSCEESYESDDYGCEGGSESDSYGCDGYKKEESDYGCHKPRFRRFRRRHHNWS